MAIKLTQPEKEQIYFCTFTCLEWMHLFKITDLYDEIYKWFDILTKRNHQISGFVIMPNHLHMIIYVAEDKSTINTILGNGKRFLAYEIVRRLETEKREAILQILASHVTPSERKRGKKHRVFEVSSDIKPCFYVHHVPFFP